MCAFGAPAIELDIRRYAALLQMADAVSHHDDPAELFRELTPILQSVLDFDFINFALYDSSEEVMKLHVWDRSEWISDPRKVAVGEAAAGLVWKTQDQLYIEDLDQEQRFELGLRWLREHNLQSYSVFPLTTARERLGALGFGSRTRHGFKPYDLQFLSRVAEMVALCVDSTVSQAALKEEKKRAQILLETESALASSLDLKQLLWAVSCSLQKIVAYDSGAIAYLDEALGLLRKHILPISEDQPLSRGEILDLADPLLGQAYRRQQAQILNQQDLRRADAADTGQLTRAGVRSLCLLPLATAKGRIGAFLLQSKRDAAFEVQQLPILSQVCSLIALALDNVLAHRHLHVQRERMQALARVNGLLAANWEVKEIFPKLSAHLRHVLHHEYASILYHEEKENRLIWQCMDFPLSKGFLKNPGISFDIGQAPAGKALIARAAMIFSRTEIEAFGTEFTSKLLAEGIKTLCCVPLTSFGGTIGTLNVASTREHAFSPEDSALLRQVAAQIAIAIENSRAVQQIEQLKDRLAEEKRYLEGEIRTEMHFEEIVGESPALAHVLEQVATVASSDATVLILGETGTGKELIARAIHRLSRRKDRGFIKLNCAAIPTGLLESELFGHEKGAFTGAVSQKIGRMEVAHEGSLFLDEIGEIPLELQPKLRRVLQDLEFERLGGDANY